jgi:hypothetical protein
MPDYRLYNPPATTQTATTRYAPYVPPAALQTGVTPTRTQTMPTLPLTPGNLRPFTPGGAPSTQGTPALFGGSPGTIPRGAAPTLSVQGTPQYTLPGAPGSVMATDTSPTPQTLPDTTDGTEAGLGAAALGGLWKDAAVGVGLVGAGVGLWYLARWASR